MLYMAVDRARGARALATALLALTLSACGPAVSGEVGRVVDVADGDTLVVRVAGDDRRVRIFGIDAPESNQAYGTEARAVARDLLLGREVIVRQRDIDQYDRVVAELTVDGTRVGPELIARGAAWHYRQFADEADYARMEATARRERVGLWRQADPVPPWVWRVTAGGRDAQDEGVPTAVETAFAGNARSQIFHARPCGDFGCSNCTVAFETAAAAVAAGYRPHSCARDATP